MMDFHDNDMLYSVPIPNVSLETVPYEMLTITLKMDAKIDSSF
jgi:hypothetical protein